MHILATWLSRRGLSDGLAGLLSYLSPLVLLIGALWWLRADAYHDGARDTDQRWKSAAAEAEKRAVKSAVNAQEKQAVRQANFAEETRLEKERIDAAVSEGGSPFDVMFKNQPVPEDRPIAP